METKIKEDHSLNRGIDDLYNKFEVLSKKVDMIENENKNTENSMKRIENTVETMNTNFESLMKKLDTIVDDKEAGKMFQKEIGKTSSLKKMILNPMRMIAVGTMSTVFEISGYASEKFSGAQEGLEDMVAEAQYKSKRRASNMMSSTQ